MSELIATRIFEAMDGLILGDEKPVDIDDLLTPNQKYELTYAIVNVLPKTDLQQVQQFQDAFKVPKEKDHNIWEFKYSELRLALILEEAMELAKALGYSNDDLYRLLLRVYTSVKDKEIVPSIVEVADALADLRVVVNGASDVFNLSEVSQELMEEVTRSNMSKLIPADHPDVLEIAKESREAYTAKGIDTFTEPLHNGYLAIRNRETGKILKPITYIEPDLKSIIDKHFND